MSARVVASLLVVRQCNAATLWMEPCFTVYFADDSTVSQHARNWKSCKITTNEEIAQGVKRLLPTNQICGLQNAFWPNSITQTLEEYKSHFHYSNFRSYSLVVFLTVEWETRGQLTQSFDTFDKRRSSTLGQKSSNDFFSCFCFGSRMESSLDWYCYGN